MRRFKTNGAKASLQANQMFFKGKDLAIIDSHDLVYAVTKHETAIKY